MSEALVANDPFSREERAVPTPFCFRRIALLVLLIGCQAPVEGAEKPPNIVFIMADDHALHAISAYGSKINRTPGIDRLARDGMKFNRCLVTNSICTPSRAAI